MYTALTQEYGFSGFSTFHPYDIFMMFCLFSMLVFATFWDRFWIDFRSFWGSEGLPNIIKFRCENWHRKKSALDARGEMAPTQPGARRGVRAEVNLLPGDRRFGRKEEK